MTGELAGVIDDLDHYEGLSGRLDDAETLYELARDEGDEGSLAEVEQSLAGGRHRPAPGRAPVDVLRRARPARRALVTIQAGEGGVDAQDWAEMLLRMYTAGPRAGATTSRWTSSPRARRRALLGRVRGQGPLRLRLPAGRAGRAPAGADEPVQRPGQAPDRLRRLRGGADARRRRRLGRHRRQGHQDGRVPGVRAAASTANKTSSAVRLTHVPTASWCPARWSAASSRTATGPWPCSRPSWPTWRRQAEAELDEIRGDQQRVGFGSQIRSYVLQPYQMQSRTSAPSTRPATCPVCSTATSTPSWRPTSSGAG